MSAMRIAAAGLALGLLAGCAGAVTGPPGQVSASDRNPVTGSRGGTSAGR